MLSTYSDYCFEQPSKQITNTSKQTSGFVYKLIRNSEYFIHKVWLCFRNYDYVLVAAIIKLSTKLRPQLYQTPTKLRRLHVEVRFDHTSFKLWIYSQKIWLFLRSYDYLFKCLVKPIVIIYEQKLSELVDKLTIPDDYVIHKLWLLFDQHLQHITMFCVYTNHGLWLCYWNIMIKMIRFEIWLIVRILTKSEFLLFWYIGYHAKLWTKLHFTQVSYEP